MISQLCALGGFGRIHLDLRLSDTAGALPYSADVTLQHTVLSGFDVLTTPWTINIRGGLDMNHQVTRTRLEYDNNECTGTPTITHAPGMRYPNGTGFGGSPSWFSSALQHSRDVNGNMEPYPYGGICRNYGTSSQWEFCDLNSDSWPHRPQLKGFTFTQNDCPFGDGRETAMDPIRDARFGQCVRMTGIGSTPGAHKFRCHEAISPYTLWGVIDWTGDIVIGSPRLTARGEELLRIPALERTELTSQLSFNHDGVGGTSRDEEAFVLFPVSFETTLNYGGGELFQSLVGLWSLPDSQVGGTSLIGAPGPTLSFAGSMSASRWGTDTIQGRTVNTLRFEGDGRVTGSMSGTSIPINDASRTLAGWFKATQTGGSGPFAWGATGCNNAYYIALRINTAASGSMVSDRGRQPDHLDVETEPMVSRRRHL